MIPVLRPHLTGSDFKAFLGLGRYNTNIFEKILSEMFKSKYALTFSTGRAGLYSILKAHGIQGKDVLISAYTCCVVTEAIVQSGNRPVFVDINKESFNAEITEALLKKHESNLGAVVITNLFGFTDYSDLKFFEKSRNCLVILDDALSPGHAPLKPSGVYDYVFISCWVRKPFTCLGGGVVFTDKDDNFRILRDYTFNNLRSVNFFKKMAKFALTLMLFAAFRKYIYDITVFMRRQTPFLNTFFSERDNNIHKVRPQYFERMLDFQKRVGINQLKKMSDLLEQRKRIGNIYYDLLSHHFPWINNYWKKDTPYSHIPFLHPERDGLKQYLLKHSIETETYFDYAVPDIKQYNCAGSFPNAVNISRQIINLPINAGLDKKDIMKVVDKIIQFDSTLKNGIKPASVSK